MKLIAHRGLVRGPNKHLENQPQQVQTSLDNGFDCEVDLWIFGGRPYLGHDGPQYDVVEKFIKQPGLWIHCKNLDALTYCQNDIKLNYFWHENDSYTMTSKGFIWAFPGKPLNEFSIMVMPEHVDKDLIETQSVSCYGICSDYILDIQKMRS